MDELALSHVEGMGTIRLAATIYEATPESRSVTLYQYRPHRRMVSLTLPLPTIRRMQEWALDADNFH